MSGRSPLVFLSHAGADTDRAKALKSRLENAPASRAAGLKVWLDKDDLKAGTGWQAQLEGVIEKHATAFVVYVGSNGIINWVEGEVRLGLSRAITDKAFPFVPVIAKESAGAAALPGFASQFQGVTDIENDGTAFGHLVSAVLRMGGAGSIKAEKEPFFGLRSIDEEHSYLFFGREKETDELLTRLRQKRLIMVIGDSGSGKSSLVRAGVISKWRGGTIAGYGGTKRNENYWHVIQFRPGRDPWQSLGDAVFSAAGMLGSSADDRGTYLKWATGEDAKFMRLGLRCGLAADRTMTLIVIDQFEEIFTSRIAPEQRRRFVDAVVALLDDPTFYIAMTMRRDYYNLLAAPETRSLYGLIESENHQRRYSLRRMSDEGLRRIVVEPLKLTDESSKQASALASAVLDDVGDRPGDLALVEFALTKAWERRNQNGGTLLESYAGIGGVEGALAGEAERVFNEVLGGNENENEISATLIRLAQLTGGAGPVRRIARRREFSESRWKILQLLASGEGNRLVLIGDASERDDAVEIAHEALFTRWPRLFAWLNAAEDDKRILENLTERAVTWSDAPPDKKDGRLAKTDSERESFEGLAARNGHWLSAEETRFVEASVEANRMRLAREEASRRRERSLRRGAVVAAAVAFIAAIVAGVFEQEKSQALKVIQRQQSQLFARLANDSLKSAEPGRVFSAARFALQGVQNDPSPGSEAARALFAVGARILPNIGSRHSDGVLAVQWDNKNHKILSLDRGLVLDRAAPEPPAPMARIRPVFPEADGQGKIVALALARSAQAIAVVREIQRVDDYYPSILQVWKFATDGTGVELCRFDFYGLGISIKWSPDEKRVAVTGSGKLLICSGAPLLLDEEPARLSGVEPTSVAWSPNGKQLGFSSDRGLELIADVSDANSRILLPPLEKTDVQFSAIAWSPDGKQIIAAASSFVESTLWKWVNVDGTWAKPELQDGSPPGRIQAMEWSADGDRLAISAEHNSANQLSEELQSYIWTRSKQTSVALGSPADHGSTSALAWAEDGRLATIDTVGLDNMVRVRRPAGDNPEASVALSFGRREDEAVQAVAWTSEGLAAAAVFNSEIVLWRLSGETTAVPIRPKDPWFDAEHAHISSEGTNLVVSARDGRLLFSTTAPGAIPELVQRAQPSPRILAAAPDGQHLALVGDAGEVYVVERKSGALRQVTLIPNFPEFEPSGMARSHGIPDPEQPPQPEPAGIALSNDGSRLAVVMQNEGGMVCVADLPTDQHFCQKVPYSGGTSRMAWSFDGSLLAIWVPSHNGSGTEIRLVRWGDVGQAPQSITLTNGDLRPSEAVAALVWSHQGKLAAAVTGRSKAIRNLLILDSSRISSNNSFVRKTADDGNSRILLGLRWRGENHLIAAINKWTSLESTLIVQYDGEGDTLAADAPLEVAGEFVGFLASENGTYRGAMIRNPGRITLYDLNNAVEKPWLDLTDLPDNALWSWADAGVLFWAVRDGRMTSFDGTAIQQLLPAQHRPLALAVSETGRIASVSTGQSLQVWNDPHASPKPIHLPLDGASIQWAPRDEFLAVSAAGKTLIFPRQANGALGKPLEVPGGRAIAWSKDLRLAIANFEDTSWSAATKGIKIDIYSEIGTEHVGEKHIMLAEPGLNGADRLSLAWSEDSNRIAVTLGTKGYVKIAGIEKLEDGELEATEIAHIDKPGLTAMSTWSSDDRFLAASAGDGEVLVWPVTDAKDLKARITERIAETALTPKELRLAGLKDLR